MSRIWKAYGVFELNPYGEDELIALFTTRKEAEDYCVMPNHVVRKIDIPEWN